MVRANLSQVVIGNTNRATESRHATGAEAEIPDISEYSRGRKGYFQIWDPQAKEITARGRTFLLGVPPDELAYCKRIVDARRGTRALPARTWSWSWPRGHAPGSVLPGRSPGEQAPGRLRQVQRKARPRANGSQPGRPPGQALRLPVVPGVPPEVDGGPVSAARPRGAPAAGAAGPAWHVQDTAYEYLTAMRDRARRA